MREKSIPGELYIEGNQISDTGAIVLNDRKKLAENGFVNVIIALDSDGNLLDNPLLISRGFVYNKEAEDLLEQARKLVAETIADEKKNGLEDTAHLKKKIYQSLNKYFYEKANRSPLILIEIMEIPVLSPV